MADIRPLKRTSTVKSAEYSSSVIDNLRERKEIVTGVSETKNLTRRLLLNEVQRE